MSIRRVPGIRTVLWTAVAGCGLIHAAHSVTARAADWQARFEAWLEQCRRERVGMDGIVQGLLGVPITDPLGPPQLVLTDLKKPNPLAFIAAKEADAGKIAADVTRLFLGIRIECAQCHNHPFDDWTRHQFWSQAAFFAGIERRGRGTFSPLVEFADRRAISPPEWDETVPAAFLDGTPLHLEAGQSARAALAGWITSPGNPYFARAVVNRVWGKLMGRGLVDPVDDFQAANPPSHPELLGELAAAFAASGFDLDLLYRAICQSDAYQRTSRQTHASQADPSRFARMTVRPMSGEQFYASLSLAVGADGDAEAGESSKDGRRQDRERNLVLELFASDGGAGDPETSVLQALTLMNGRLVNDAASPTRGGRLRAVLKKFPSAIPAQVEALYLATLSRPPTADERRQAAAYLAGHDGADRAARLGDVFWVLLNSAEFRRIH
jgi:hypothetical protein